jgi:hypothetical protein|tara:strand:+ start:26820 stop:27545 length:726 start_codon:yes stop_codon:yes gene_type:complete
MALITAAKVISKALTNQNVDTHLIKDSFIEIAELNFIKPAIGEDLYRLINEEKNNGTVWSYTKNDCIVTSDSKTITCSASTSIKVGDFISGTGIPLGKDNGDGELCRVETVNVPGAVTSFTISGTPTAGDGATGIPLYFKTPNGKLVEDYIENYLAFCVKFEILPDMTYNTTSQGVVENVADFTVPVDSKKLSFLRNETYKKSETYLLKMTQFLDDNSEAFPDYCNENLGGVSKKNGIILY